MNIAETGVTHLQNSAKQLSIPLRRRHFFQRKNLWTPKFMHPNLRRSRFLFSAWICKLKDATNSSKLGA